MTVLILGGECGRDRERQTDRQTEMQIDGQRAIDLYREMGMEREESILRTGHELLYIWQDHHNWFHEFLSPSLIKRWKDYLVIPENVF